MLDPVSIIYESPHPYENNDSYGQQVDLPSGAMSMLVYFGRDTSTEWNYDFVKLCKDSTCGDNWGSFSGINFPGIYPIDSLNIPATSLYIWFSSDDQNTDLGFDVTITPIYGIEILIHFFAIQFMF